MTPCGTVGYTAPEIVKDERYSKSVDMWALGCVLYTLLCGFPPFYDESISVLTEKVAKGSYTFLSPWWDDISKSAQDLVSHLLTVDPEKRYTIEEFMNHPWIKGTDEETHAAFDAPPLATPAVGKGPSAASLMMLDLDYSPAPNQAGKRMDFRSPGAVALREVFDVGYAVHRMEEEGKRRKNWKQGYRGGGANHLLNAMDEEDEYDSDEDESNQQERGNKAPRQSGDATTDDVAESLKRTNLNNNPAGAPPPNSAAQRYHAARKEGPPPAGKTTTRRKGPFELSLDNATLLGRRKKVGGPDGDHHEGHQEGMRDTMVQVA